MIAPPEREDGIGFAPVNRGFTAGEPVGLLPGGGSCLIYLTARFHVNRAPEPPPASFRFQRRAGRRHGMPVRMEIREVGHCPVVLITLMFS